ncbi:MAG TPA: hypothetical protein VH113_04005 [Gemmatimonadales bacterium]|jgi:hypothetical protein|nr:hypothetical protein [Gemmatimonadales bacterium]
MLRIELSVLQRTKLTDDDLLKALVRQSEALGTLGQTTRANDCIRVAGELRNAMKEHEVASEEVLRRERLAQAPTARAEDPVALTLVVAVRKEWRTLLDQMREHGKQLIGMPAERRTSPR